MAQVQAEQRHRQNVEGRDERVRKAAHHHAVHIVVQRVSRVLQAHEFRVGEAEREVHQVIDDEGKDDQAAREDRPRCIACGDRLARRIFGWPRVFVFRHQLQRRDDMHHDDGQQTEARTRHHAI